jgi:hypothetical protein
MLRAVERPEGQVIASTIRSTAPGVQAYREQEADHYADKAKAQVPFADPEPGQDGISTHHSGREQ